MDRLAKQRRNYSKGGCRECKRRKIKCDEAKPACMRCTRMLKDCLYPNPGETVLRMLTSQLQLLGLYQKGLSIRQYQPKPDKRERDDDAKALFLTLPILILLNEPEPFVFSEQDVEQLAAHLAQIIHTLYAPEAPHDHVDLAQAPRQPLPLLPAHNQPMELVSLLPLEKPFFLEVYYNFSSLVLPWGRWDGLGYTNPLRDLLVLYLAREPIVRAAMIGVGANAYWKRLQDPAARQASHAYLHACVELIETLLRTRLADVETLLLTSLFLTVSSASTPHQDWRSHMEGARDILIKTARARKTHVHAQGLKTFIVCKFWYITIEVLAGISLKRGGTLAPDEIDLVLTYSDDEIKVLTEFGLIHPEGWQILSGYNLSLFYLYRDLIKHLRAPELDYKEALRLLQGFHAEFGRVFLSPDGLVLKDGPYVDHGRLWLDVSHQMYTHAAVATVLVQFYNVAWLLLRIQQICSHIISLVDGVELRQLPLQHLPLMVQWPLWLALKHVEDSELREKGRGVLRVCLKLGLALATVALLGHESEMDFFIF